MTKKLILSLFVSVFLLALVSSLSVSDVSLGNVNAGQTVPVNIVINNMADSSNYSVAFNSLDISFSQTTVSNNTIKPLSANYLVPSNQVGSKNVSVEYTYSNSSGFSATKSFNISMNIVAVSSLDVTKLQELTFNQNGRIKVENKGNSDLLVTLSESGNAEVSFSSNNFTLAAGESLEVEVSATNLNNLAFGNNAVTITASSSKGSDSISFNLESTFCPVGEVGKNLSIDDVSISSSGDDDEEWKFLDTITVEVRVKNVGNDDVDNVNVELALYDSNGDDVSGDLEFFNDEEEQIEVGDLNDGDKETATFEFRVPIDFDAGNYKLAVRAYSDDISLTEVCADKSNDLSDKIYESISVNEEDDEGKFIGFDNVELSSEEFTCGDSGSISFEAFNVGEDDQDRVRVTMYNDALNIEQTYEIRNGFDVGDSQDITFSFDIPNAKDGNYNLNINAEYDYRSGNYREELEEEFKVPIKLIGCSVVPTTDRIASITTVLDDAKAGSELVVEATVRNLADEEKAFIIDLEDYESFAELVSVSDRTLTLDAGESETVIITLKINKDASAEESFTINAISDSKSESKEVSVFVESRKGFSFSNNSLVWVIGAVNLILIILIILVAIKLSRK